MAKLLFHISTLLQILQSSIKAQPTCKNNAKCSCTVKNADIYWNITIDNPFSDNLLLHHVYMQTKGVYSAADRWHNSTNCVKSVYGNILSISCRIVKPLKHWDAYEIRLVCDRIIPVASVQPQDGFYCYPNHHIQHLRQSSMTQNSANISWTLNDWDVSHRFLSETIMQIKYKGFIYHEEELSTSSDINYVYTVNDLNPCTQYDACVINIYRAYDGSDIESCTQIQTSCKNEKDGSKILIKKAADSHSSIIIISSVLLCLTFIVLTIYFVCRRRSRMYRTISLISMCEDQLLHDDDITFRPFIIPRANYDDEEISLKPIV